MNRILQISMCLVLVGSFAAFAQDERFRARITGLENDTITCVALRHDSSLTTLGYNSGGVSIHNPIGAKFIGVSMWNGHARPVTGTAFAPDGKLFATSSLDGTVKVWETATAYAYQKTKEMNPKANTMIPQPKWVLNASPGGVHGVQFSPDGKTVVAACGDGNVRIFGMAKGNLTQTISAAHKGPVLSVGFSSDGKRIVSGGQDKSAKVWKLELKGKNPLVLLKHPGPVTTVAFSPDDARIATGSGVAMKSGIVRIWESESGKEEFVLDKFDDMVMSVAFHPKESARLAVGSRDLKLRVWDLEKKEIGYTDDHAKEVLSVAFSADGKLLGSASPDTAKWWDGTPPLKQQ